MEYEMHQYTYQALPPIAESGRTPPFTRLLFLEAGNGDDPFRGHLQVVDIENAFRYEALSYTWGTEESRTSIWLEGRPLSIKPNLEGALRHLRLPTQVRVLWIDAICIDQSNLSERSRQVLYMRSVYKYAWRVIVWLGLKVPGIEEAFQLVKTLADVNKSFSEPVATSQGTDEMVDQETMDAVVSCALEDLPPTSMQYLNDVFDREYFVRSWCVQEVVASSAAIAKCENLEIDFLDLLATVSFAMHWRGQMFGGKPFEFWNAISLNKQAKPSTQIFHKSEVEGSMGPLLTILAGTRDFKATDPRDKIFSLFGITDEGIQPVLGLTQVMSSGSLTFLKMMRKGITSMQNYVNNLGPNIDFARPAALKPDYTKDVVSVYCDTTRFMVRKSPRVLDVLGHVQHTSDPTIGPYPSWVPKWFEPRSCSVLSVGCFLAGLCDGHFRYFAELHDCPLRGNSVRPRVLSLDGYRFDVVQLVSDVMIIDLTGEVPVERVWSQLLPFPMVPHLDTPYRTGEPLDVAFCMTLLASPLGAGLSSMNDFSSTPRSDLKERFNQQAQSDVTQYLNLRTRQHDLSPSSETNNSDTTRFMQGARIFSHNRRAFLTRNGRLGIGPKMMQPGDEVVVFFGGRMPFVVRPMPDHHVFVGDCYIRDDELMWGKVTEAVRFKRGGPPVFTFELR